MRCLERHSYEDWMNDMATKDSEDDGAGPDDVDNAEAVIACLGDDAAKLREANPECEIAANMEAAAELLASLCERAPSRRQLLALSLMLDHYGDDERTQCLRSLLPEWMGPNVF